MMSSLFILSLLSNAAPLDRAIERMGGLDRLVHIQSVQVNGLSAWTMPEQSGSYQGPWLSNAFDLDETYDFTALSYQSNSKVKGVLIPKWIDSKFTVTFGEKPEFKGRPIFVTPQELLERLTLDPVRAVLFAKVAKDAKSEGQAVRFTLMKQDVVLRFDPTSGFLSSIETVSAREGFWRCWADVRSQTTFGNWQLDKNGLCLPWWWVIKRNGIQVAEHQYTGLTPTSNPSLTLKDIERQWNMLANLTYAIPSAASIPTKQTEVAPGVEQYAATFPTQVFVLKRGLVVVDPGFSTEFAQQVMADIKKRYPSKPILAIVASDPYWAHFGGLRAYAHEGIPIYAAKNNLKQLKDLLNAPSAKRPEPTVQIKLKPVGKQTKIDELILAELPGPETERMVAVYLPSQKLVFASDSIVLRREELFSNETADEVVRTVKELGWNVEWVYATHNALIPWTKLLEVLSRK